MENDNNKIILPEDVEVPEVRNAQYKDLTSLCIRPKKYADGLMSHTYAAAAVEPTQRIHVLCDGCMSEWGGEYPVFMQVSLDMRLFFNEEDLVNHLQKSQISLYDLQYTILSEACQTYARDTRIDTGDIEVEYHDINDDVQEPIDDFERRIDNIKRALVYFPGRNFKLSKKQVTALWDRIHP